MSMQSYIANMMARVADNERRTRENAEEAEAAKAKALDDARRYLWGLDVQRPHTQEAQQENAVD